MMLACLLTLYREFSMRPFPHCGMLLSFFSTRFFLNFILVSEHGAEYVLLKPW